ncbi:MAG: DUF4295 family protein, partial [Candidatus Neomarinimicrobiota bacterium]|nr:DUF4295 family protein [Candidatus Neomarinimicrobiota bacterium]
YAKYVKSVQSEKTGRWRFNEQMVRMDKGEQLDAALKRMDEVANLIDIDLSEFVKSDDTKEKVAPEAVAETIMDSVKTETDETFEDGSASEESAEQADTVDDNPSVPGTVEERSDEPVSEESTEVSDLSETSEDKGNSEEE